MPKTRNGYNTRRSNITCVPFRQLVTAAMSGGTLQRSVYPANLGSLASIAAGFEFFRVKSLNIRLYPRAAGANDIAVAYFPDATVGGASSVAQLMETPDALFMPGANEVTIPRSLKIPSVRLQGQIPWFKATIDASDIEFESQGTLVWFGTSTEVVDTELWGVVEFRNPLDSSLAMARLKDQLRAEVVTEMSSSLRPRSNVGGKAVGLDESKISSPGCGRVGLRPTSD